MSETPKIVPKCLDCKFAFNVTPRWTFSECRRFPPVFAGESGGDAFPNVADSSWCGEFSANRKGGRPMSESLNTTDAEMKKECLMDCCCACGHSNFWHWIPETACCCDHGIQRCERFRPVKHDPSCPTQEALAK